MRWELDRESDRFSSIPDADTTKGYSVFYEGGEWTAVRHERIGEGFPDHQEALDFCCRDAGRAPGLNEVTELQPPPNDDDGNQGDQDQVGCLPALIILAVVAGAVWTFWP